MRFYQLISFCLLFTQVITCSYPSSQGNSANPAQKGAVMASQEKTVTPLSPAQVSFSEKAVEQKAMTWRVLQSFDTGQKRYVLFGSDQLTDPYQGDTNIQESRALLCLKKLNLPLPSELPPTTKTPGGALRGSWSGARVVIIPKVKGSELTSLEIANERCRLAGLKTWKEDGFRMAEFHDGDQEAGWAGWDFWAEIPPSQCIDNRRYWVWINDQPPANPW
ncbi:hypothetical protein [Alkalinema sp. FACHB-956]|uniref:hypothetical protein n=1 Tax=Alkalinema sp. FACHB-956 TaxID=2692768 RepID=UPI0016867F92|nr:hypothetical protein [Alkalinema sp. FACHB-956]MBD2327121.1 hypothetical protein [Alkalinema sp. FACHB-956]